MLPDQILTPTDGPVAEIVNPEGRTPVCLVCEHASAAIPDALGDLGLATDDRFSHAVWDLGAAALAGAMSQRLDAPLYLAGFSRLVYDCNRPPERADAMPQQTELIAVPGNAGIGAAERAARTRDIYDAFHAGLQTLLDGFAGPVALVTVHSFTPTWHGAPRPTEIGLLHDDDADLAQKMMAHAGPGFSVVLNEPYSAADGVTHMLARHGTARAIPNVMIEVRNDLLATDTQVAEVADALVAMLTPALRLGEARA